MTGSSRYEAALHTITAHIVVPEASAGAAWYGRAFGTEERSRVTLPDGKVMTLVLRLGDAELHLASEFPDFGIVSPLRIGGTATILQIAVADADAAWKQALDAGAEVVHDLTDQFWGERDGQVQDPFGHRWNIAQHLRDVSQEELDRGAAEAFGG